MMQTSDPVFLYYQLLLLLLLLLLLIFKTFFIFVLKEIPESLVNEYLELLRGKHQSTSKPILCKGKNVSENHQTILRKGDETRQKALSTISHVGCALSAVGLTLTILTICLSRYKIYVVINSFVFCCCCCCSCSCSFCCCFVCIEINNFSRNSIKQFLTN